MENEEAFIEKWKIKVGRYYTQARKAMKDGLRQRLCSKSTQGNKNQWPNDLDDESEWILIKFTYDAKVEGAAASFERGTNWTMISAL